MERFRTNLGMANPSVGLTTKIAFSETREKHAVDTEAHAEIVNVHVLATAKLPTRFGEFKIVAIENDKDGLEHVALVKGDVNGADDVPLRMHSECLTGDVLSSLRCDCREQLMSAMRRMAEGELGIILYMRQEGRGIGLHNKIRAYELQDKGMDTVQANHALGFPADLREYSVAAAMLKSLGVKSVVVLTNNPSKIAGLERSGISVHERISHVVPPNSHNKKYLQTKMEKLHHLLGDLFHDT